ncbi:MAG: TadE/TadG family type IV pilus assembly protein [Bacilli bacterium]
MKDNSGQALIEFVLILPILIFMIFSIIDFGRIIYTRNHLESKTSDLVSSLDTEKTYDEMLVRLNKNSPYPIGLKLNYGSDNYLTIELTGEVSILTPGLNLILGNPHSVVVKRVVPYEP